MHIADLTLFFAPHSGGVKRYLLAKHAHFQAHAGIRHSLIVPGEHDAETEPGIFEMKSPRIPGAGGYRLPLRTGKWRALLHRLSPDLIEAGDPYHLAWTALAAARDLDIPAVAFAHSDLSRVLAHHVTRIAGPLTDRYLRHLYRRFDLVMAPSQSIADRLASNGVGHVVVQALGVDGETFHPRRRDASLRAELQIAEATRLLIFAGRMAREKHIPLLIDAMQRLGSGYHLLLVGGECHERIADKVTVLPYEQQQIRLARLLASADALVHAGDHETFGLIVIEAMACGLPVVGVRSGALTELITEDVGVLAEPNDAASFSAAIRTLFTMDRRAMSRRARAKIEASYTWKSTFAAQAERYALLTQRVPRPDFADADAVRAQ